MNRPQAFPVAARQLAQSRSVLEFLRLLWAIDHALQKHSRRMTRELGVTSVQRLAIRVLGRYPDLTPGQLAGLLHLHPSTVTGIVQRLQRGGFVLRRVDRSDHRRCRLALTAKGCAVDARRGGTVEAELETALQKIDRAALATAERVLTAIGEQLARARAEQRIGAPSRASPCPGRSTADAPHKGRSGLVHPVEPTHAHGARGRPSAPCPLRNPA